MTPPRTLARYRAFTGSRGGIIPKGSRPQTPAGRRGRRPLQRPTNFPTIVHARTAYGMAYPRQMFHVEHLPDFFVGKNPFLSLLFVL